MEHLFDIDHLMQLALQFERRVAAGLLTPAVLIQIAAVPAAFFAAWLLRAKLDEAMSHLIEAGSDFFVMPSLFEPCGLNQMYSQVYGTVPVVSRVGGLVDTVTDADEQPASGTGLMCDSTAASLRAALDRALALFADKPRYAAVQQRGMARDFSWKKAAAGYETLYRESV